MKIDLHPLFRFSEFEASWNLRSLGELYDIDAGYAFKRSDYIDIGIPLINGESIKNGNISNKNLNFLPTDFKEKYKKFILKTDDIVIALNRPITNGSLKISQIPTYLDGSLLYQRAGKVINFSKLDIDFSYQLLTKEVTKFVLKEAVGSDQPFISTTKLKNWLLATPNQLEEQMKIGRFFRDLDETISLHQQELEVLKQTKQGFLQKMFPKDGEIFPELRFKTFVESWREVSLGAISDSYSGGTPSAGNKQYYNGTIPFIRSAEINSSTTELFLTEEGLSNSSAKLVQKGTILYAMYGATSGEVGISRIDGAINQAILAIKPKEEYDIQFLYQYLKKSKKSIVNSYLQGGQGNLSGAIIKKVPIWLPENREEQIKIGKFFRELDEVIELKEKELDALKETKKGFLQKMFV